MPFLTINLRVVVVVVFLTVFFSKLVWYDLRTIYPGQASSILSVSFLWYSAVLLPFIFFLLLKELKVVIRSNIILMFFSLNVFGLIIGILQGNLNIFLLQDIYKFLFFPAGFAAAVYCYDFQTFDGILYKIYWVLVVFSVIRLIIHYYLSEDISFLYGTVHDIFLISMSVAMIWKNPLRMMTAVAVILSILLGNKRTLLALLVMNLVLSSVSFMGSLNTFLWLRRIIFLSLCTVIIGLYVYTGKSVVYKRVLNTTQTYGEDIGKDSKRHREVTVAFDLMQKGAPLSFWLGFGSGAFFYDPVPNVRTGESITHSIHFTPMAFFYRYGTVGLVFIAVLYISFIRIFFLFKFSNDKVVDYSVKATIIGSLVMSFLVYSFQDDVFLGFIYGIYSLKSNRYNSNFCCRKSLHL